MLCSGDIGRHGSLFDHHGSDTRVLAAGRITIPVMKFQLAILIMSEKAFAFATSEGGLVRRTGTTYP